MSVEVEGYRLRILELERLNKEADELRERQAARHHEDLIKIDALQEALSDAEAERDTLAAELMMLEALVEDAKREFDNEKKQLRLGQLFS